MIRILHTIDTTGPGGAETVFINLAKGLDVRRFRSFAAITGFGWVYDTLRKHGIDPILIPCKGSFNLRYLLGLVNIIREHGINLVQSHLLGSNLYCSLAGLICRVPVVSTFHGFVDTSETERLMRIKCRLLNMGSQKIVFVSNKLSTHYLHTHGISPQKAVTIHNGIDISVFRPKKDESIRRRLGIGPDHMLIGALGNIRPAKSYDLFLKVARLVHDKFPDTRFVIAGQGSDTLYESLLRLRKQLNLEHAFHFLGFMQNAAEFLNNLDIFVITSLSEGFSMSTIEAMACRIPVIVTRSGGPEEILSHGYSGIVTECSESGLYSAIKTYLNDSTLMHSLVRNAYDEVTKEYSLKRMLNCYEASYIEAFR